MLNTLIVSVLLMIVCVLNGCASTMNKEQQREALALQNPPPVSSEALTIPPDEKLSTPEKTIKYLFDSLAYGDAKGIEKCAPGGGFASAVQGKEWLKVKIVKKITYDKNRIAKNKILFGIYNDLPDKPIEGDVDIIDNEHQAYLLRKFGKNWRIIQSMGMEDDGL